MTIAQLDGVHTGDGVKVIFAATSNQSCVFAATSNQSSVKFLEAFDRFE